MSLKNRSFLKLLDPVHQDYQILRIATRNNKVSSRFENYSQVNKHADPPIGQELPFPYREHIQTLLLENLQEIQESIDIL